MQPPAVQIIASVLADNPLVYDNGVLANLWLNGDLRLAMGVYFGALARNEPLVAEKARAAIDGVMSKAGLEHGGTRYVGFWGEVEDGPDGLSLLLITEGIELSAGGGVARMRFADSWVLRDGRILVHFAGMVQYMDGSLS